MSRQARRLWAKRLRRAERLKRRGKKVRFGNARKTNYIEAPRIFSLKNNYEETLCCLGKLKDSIVEAQRLGKMRPNTYIDLTKIEDLQPAAAIVLAAELDRWRRVLGIALRPRNIRHWNKSVLTFLNDLGLFELLEIDRRHVERVIREKTNGEASRVALRFVSDCRNDKEPTDRLADQLAEKVPEFRERLEEAGDMALSTALAEASLNSVQHGYKYLETHYPVEDHRWWAAASYQDGRKTVKFFVYDQGVGIPATLPKTKIGKEILNLFRVDSEGVSRLNTQSEMIRKVLTNRMSSTGASNRGKGFPQIVAAASQKGGSLRVLSGKGGAIYTCDNGAEALPVNGQHLGGTLLEWTFRLDRM